MKISAVNSTSPPPAVEQKQTAERKTAGVDLLATSANTSHKEVLKAVEKMNEDAEAANRQIRFALREETHRIVVEVVDKETQQVVASFPPKQILDMMASFAKEAKDNADSTKIEKKVQKK